MKKGGGKNKGSGFERDICRLLSKWWTDDERDDIFWLTAGSGARATTRSKSNKKTANQYGDVTFIDELGKPLIDLCLFELKRGYSSKLDLLCTIDKNYAKSQLYLFWLEAEKEREDAERPFSCLIFKRDRGKECIVISLEFFNKIVDQCGKFKNCFCELNIENCDIIIFRLSDFLQWVCREDMCQILTR